ncbi:MAG: complex I subunit 5 family protein [Candidatus Heimdallarchaeaceae archaeon]
MSNWYLPLIILVPIIGAMLLALFEQIKTLLTKIRINPEIFTNITANIVALLTLGLGAYSVTSTSTWKYNTTPNGLLSYGLLEAILVTLFAFLVWLAVLFSADYMKGKNGLGFYYALIFTLLAGLSSLVMASNYFTFFIAWELMALSSYALVSFERQKRGAVESSLKYFIMSTAGSLFVLLATALTFGLYGTLDFEELMKVSEGSNVTAIILALFIIGFGVTASMIFLNAWLPDAHSNAPSTISALLSGIVVKAGAYAFYRTIYWAYGGYYEHGLLGDTSLVISWLGILTMLEGNLMVFAQFWRKDIIDFKRILAYSTTVHLGYVILGLGAGTKLGVESSILHIITHALGKGALFLLSGTMIAAVSSRDLRKMKGLGRRSPIIATTLTVGLLSLGGIPITGGFVSKLLIILSALNSDLHSYGMNVAIVILAVINSILALGGYLYLLKYIVFDEPEEKSEAPIKVPVWEAIALIILVISLIVIGLWPTKLFSIIEKAVKALDILL